MDERQALSDRNAAIVFQMTRLLEQIMYHHEMYFARFM